MNANTFQFVLSNFMEILPHDPKQMKYKIMKLDLNLNIKH